jgi:hypothetical protein
MNRFLLLVVATIIIFSASLLANIRNFEGNINFVRQTVFDTTHISIFVKDNMVRVDEFDSKKRVISSQLINLNTKEVFALSHENRLYTQLKTTPPALANSKGVVVQKTENSKQINGQTCYQWRVKDPERNTEIAYWVFEENLDFFATLLQLLNRTEYSLAVFREIPGSIGFFPMLTEERTLLRKEKLKIALVDINEKELNSGIFKIPSGYKAVNR